MTSEKFWTLTLYEWSLVLLQVKRKAELIMAERRFHMDMWGNYMALYRNAHVDLKKEKPWTLKDVYPRPEEIEEKETGGYTQEEFLERAEKIKEKRAKKKANKNNGSISNSSTGN